MHHTGTANGTRQQADQLSAEKIKGVFAALRLSTEAERNRLVPFVPNPKNRPVVGPVRDQVNQQH